MGVPNSLALGPDGNLYIGFKKQGGILRINNPATASSAGFGTCTDFVQLIAQTPGGGGNGLAFIGHDLWGALETGPFVIANADTTCQALPPSVTPTVQKATCPTAPATTAVLAALTPTAMYSDQTYPFLNGNNLYFGDKTDDMWAGNISGDPAGAAFVVDPFEQQPGPEPGTVFFLNGLPPNVNAITADMTDPANVVAYSGDDVSAAALLAQGRWWEVFQNPSPLAAPPAPTVVRTSAVGSTLTISWSPAQAALPVTSYTVHAITGAVADQTVSAPLGAATFPPNFLVLTGLAAGPYSFEVSATNASGTGAFSAASTAITLPVIVPPGIPTNVSATAGDTAAFVSFAAPPNSAFQGITGYLVTSIPGGVTATTPANATTNIPVSVLTDNTTYTFVVQAINAGGNSLQSTPSNPVTPVAAPLANSVTIAIAGPTSVASVPIMSTFTATLKNVSAAAVTISSFGYALATTDGAAVLIGQPGQGTCTTTSTIAVSCNIGSLAPGASININFLVQIKTNPITGTVNFTAVGNIPGSATITTATPSAPPQGGPGPSVAVAVTASSAKPTLNTGTATTHTFVATNTTATLANVLSFTISEPAQLTITGVTALSSAAATDPVSCLAPVAGTLNGQPVNNIVCSIASLGGNLKNGNKPTTAQTITITVNVTAPAPKLSKPINLAVSSVVTFNGSDSLNPSANFTQTVK
jgi:hypothetical protein